MQAWQVSARGEPRDVLERAERSLPEPGPGQLRIRVEAAALGLPDVFLCRGSYAFDPPLPFVPGQEVAGIVSASAEDGPPVGTRVVAVTAFFLGHGGLAEEALALVASTHPMPQGLTAVEAAGFTIPFHTAWLGLVRRGRLAEGETLLVHGAAGGSGAAAVRLGKALGARVIAVVGDSEKAAFVRALGADDVVLHREVDVVEAVRERTAGRGADVVFDPVGGEVFQHSLRCLANEGRLLAVGFASGAWADARTEALVRSNASVVGVFVGAYAPEEMRACHEAVSELFAAGRLEVVPGPQVGFDEVPDALQAIADRRAIGKTVVRIRA